MAGFIFIIHYAGDESNENGISSDSAVRIIRS